MFSNKNHNFQFTDYWNYPRLPLSKSCKSKNNSSRKRLRFSTFWNYYFLEKICLQTITRSAACYQPRWLEPKNKIKNSYETLHYRVGRVQLFWESHKNMLNRPYDFDIYLVNVKTMRTIVLILVAFSEKLNFKWNHQHIP